MKINGYKFLLLFLLLPVVVTAQTIDYRYGAKVNNVDSSGFYNIVLTPELNAHLKIDCSDFRIINDSGKWIPHLLRIPNEEFTVETCSFSLNIIKKEIAAPGTEIIILNPDSSISNLTIELKNTLAERYCTLTGSDDQSNWYVINDSIAIRPEKKDDTSSIFSIKFPAVNYKFLKIDINDRGKNPFRITGISTVRPCMDSRLYLHRVFQPAIENPSCTITQIDSSNFSFIKVLQTDSFQFNQVNLKMSGSKYYSRKVDMYLFSSAENSLSNLGSLIGSFEISNNSSMNFRLPLTKAKAFCIVIFNEDNPVLKTEKVQTLMIYRVATAWLEKEKHYSILLGNPAAGKPDYDLQKSEISSSREFPIAEITALHAIPQATIIAHPVSNNKWMIWLLIFIAILVLGFFTYKLMSEMNKSKL